MDHCDQNSIAGTAMKNIVYSTHLDIAFGRLLRDGGGGEIKIIVLINIFSHYHIITTECFRAKSNMQMTFRLTAFQSMNPAFD